MIKMTTFLALPLEKMWKTRRLSLPTTIATMNASMSRIEPLRRGFTIVELLVVITIIVILAAMTLVVYNNLQNGSYDAAVKSDLDNASGLFESFRVSSSAAHQFPRTKTPDLDSLNVTATKNSYDVTTTVNYVYCINTTDYQSFALVALSKTGSVFLITQDGFQNTTITKADFSSGTNICNTKLGLGLVSSGMYAANTWQTWVHS
jgi:type IV pilus assembly protein PilA